ncbi:MGS domain protein [Alkalidesulfovibrio alkalitolerans DSM 16529]|jgi:phosphoribosylaminoimidazolecarboxamide formyltransferase/IMP cyclohydrolase|uniref:MGS domain protein n=1 Tax=Alkalidesulfovibrio alkalitolerans DSM 16529 TaxID=1121439 RepID=S7T327_9BACT|nr:MGS domain protein [Alkalidesulfovibrio alkalitolerans]EPR30991.1 MGS domain protein [Alkalidesulfovibrio alkalitolerans DSM 16529]
MDMLPINRALLSVTDKAGLADFARFLVDRGATLVSTGGTKKLLASEGLPVTGVSEVTGFPEIMNGRVKTLHPHIHGGILADKDNPEHLAVLAELGIAPFDLICVNLYDFADAARRELELKQAVEQIDVGGPTMLRASAKNFHSVLVVPDPAFYKRIMEELSENGMKVGLGLRREMAAETFRRISRYDALIADYLFQHEV